MRSLFKQLRRFLAELRRRNVYRVVGAYLVAAFVAVQIAEVAAGAFGLPGWFQPMIWVICGLGFPIALVLAWALEITPEGVRATPETAESGTEPEASSSRLGLLVGISTIVVALGLGSAWWLTTEEVPAGPAGTEVTERSVAVLPFAVTGSGAEGLSEGMVSMLSTGLDGAAGLRAVSDRRVFAVWEQADTSQTTTTGPPALQAARRIGSEYAVIGSAVALASDLQLTANVYETASGRSLGQARVRGPADSMMVLADELTRKILDLLLERSEERIPSVDLASITTESLPAYKEFLAGERRLRAGQYTRAIDHFETAIGRDSSFALAYARLYLARVWTEENQGPALRRAEELAGQLPRRDARLVRALDLRRKDHFIAARDSLRQLTKAYPDDPDMWYHLGEVIYHGAVPRGPEEAEAAFQRAAELDPDIAPYHHHLVDLAFFFRRDSSLAARRIRAAPKTPERTQHKWALDLAFGNRAQREAVLNRLDTTSIRTRWSSFWPVWISLHHPRDGAIQDRVLRRLRAREDTDYELLGRLILRNNLERGLIRQAHTDIGQFEVKRDRVVRIIAMEMSVGVPIPDSMRKKLVGHGPAAGEPTTRGLWARGLYRADQGRMSELPALIERFKEIAAEEGVPDSQIQRDVQELSGYRAFRAGNLEQARALWAGQNAAWLYGAVWRGDLYRQLGELETAEGWYLAAWWHPLAHERLGRLYEEMNRPEKAAAAYERFIAAWEHADPALQPRVEQARKRLQALTGEPGRVSATSTGRRESRGGDCLGRSGPERLGCGWYNRPF